MLQSCLGQLAGSEGDAADGDGVVIAFEGPGNLDDAAGLVAADEELGGVLRNGGGVRADVAGVAAGTGFDSFGGRNDGVRLGFTDAGVRQKKRAGH